VWGAGGAENRGAVGAEFERRRRRAGRGMVREYPLPQPTRGSGERRKLPISSPSGVRGFGAF